MKCQESGAWNQEPERPRRPARADPQLLAPDSWLQGGSPSPRRATAAVLDIRLPEPVRQSKRLFHYVENSVGHVALGEQRQVDLLAVASENRHAIVRDLESGAGLSGVVQDHIVKHFILHLRTRMRQPVPRLEGDPDHHHPLAPLERTQYVGRFSDATASKSTCRCSP